jgi:hypothetical protein
MLPEGFGMYHTGLSYLMGKKLVKPKIVMNPFPLQREADR